MQKLLLALAALTLLPAAAAHVTVTATAPTTALQPGVPVDIPVTASASCAAVLGEYQAMDNTRLHFGLGPDTPFYLAGNGTAFDFTVDKCDPQPAGEDPATAAQVRATGTVRVTASILAPALTIVKAKVIVLNADGGAEAGEAEAQLQIAPFAKHNVTAGTPVATASGVRVPFTVRYQANLPTQLTVAATVEGKAIAAPAPQRLAPLYETNKTEGLATFEVEVPAGLPAGKLQVATTLAPLAGAAEAGAASVQLPATAAPEATTTEGDGHAHEESPAPAALLVLGVVMVAAAAARRTRSP